MPDSATHFRLLPILAAFCLLMALGWWAASLPTPGSLGRGSRSVEVDDIAARAPDLDGAAPTLQGRPRADVPTDWDALPPLSENEASILCRVVHAETGEPLAGVPVLATLGYRNPECLAQGTTGPNGRCELEVSPLDERAVQLIVTGGDWVNAEFVCEEYKPPRGHPPWLAPVRAGERVPFDVSVLPGAVVVGTVLNADGRPVASGSARIHAPGGSRHREWRGQPAFPWSLTAQADVGNDGRFRLGGLPWGVDVCLIVRGPSGVPALSDRIALRPPKTSMLTTRLPATRRARIRAVDASSGASIAKAVLRVGRSVVPMRYGVWAVSDADGWSAFPGLAEDALFVRIEAYGYDVFRSWKVATIENDAWVCFELAADGAYEATIQVTPAARLAGTVETAGDCDRMLMVSAREVDAPSSARHVVASVEKDGTFRLTVPPGTRWVLEAKDLECTWTTCDLVEAASGDEDVRLAVRELTAEELAAQDAFVDELEIEPFIPGERKYTWAIEGRVVDVAGRPVQGIEVAASGREISDRGVHGSTYSGLSDAAGRFAVQGSGVGPLEVQTLARGRWPVSAVMSVAPGAGDIVLRMREGVRASLLIRDEDGAPVAGAEVRVYETNRGLGPATRRPPFGRTWVSDSSGPVLLEGLTRDRTYRVRISAWTSEERLSDVVLSDWRPRDEIVTLARRRRISGVVHSPEGRPVAGALVFVRAVGESWPTKELITDADGRFVTAKLDARCYVLGVCLASLEPYRKDGLLRVEAEAGADDVRLELYVGRSLRIRLPRAEPEIRTVRFLHFEITPLDASSPTIPTHQVKAAVSKEEKVVHGLREGVRYRVWLRHPSEGQYALADVEPGDAGAALRFRPGGTIHVRFIASEGQSPREVSIRHQGVTLSTWKNEDGRTFTLHRVPPGTWPVTLSWRESDGDHERTLPGRAGDTLLFDLTTDPR